MFRDNDFDIGEFPRFVPHRERDVPWQHFLPSTQGELVQDLELPTLLQAMASGDEFLFEVARMAVLSGLSNDAGTILYRHEALRDCLNNSASVRQLYDIAVLALERSKDRSWGMSSHYSSSLLYGAIGLLEALSGILRQLRVFSESLADRFNSEAFRNLFAVLRAELSDDYLKIIQNHLAELKFRKGTLLGAQLGEWNESANLILHCIPAKKQNLLQRLVTRTPRTYSFQMAQEDVTGARILSSMTHRGISRASIALAQSADHVLGFFKSLRAELGFYVCCLNLHDRLAALGEPFCFPTPVPAGSRRASFNGLHDVCLSLQMKRPVVGNSCDLDNKSLVIITGPNQGGKSSFLRSVGLAQVMMQAGMFVGAEQFQAEICPALFTHYKREEDSTMKSGKFDEELARMSEIADQITPNSIFLLNESFAATNEREGSEIANQIVAALLEKGVKVVYVTHLYGFARVAFEGNSGNAMFLRAERKPDGTRTFKILEGEPLETSYGADLYREIFAPNVERQTA
jgi:DNA mismatch repair ATPase MutS